MNTLERIMRDEQAVRYPPSPPSTQVLPHVVLFVLCAPPVAIVQFAIYGSLARFVEADPVVVILAGAIAATLSLWATAYLTFQWSKS